tara:strand:+ start:6464 stop:6907 length:444 start_codon:yes stop_codon:yes gene_type:complete
MKKSTATVTGSGDTKHLVLEFDIDSDGWFLYAHTSLDTAPTLELWHMTKEDAQAQAQEDYGVGIHDWSEDGDDNTEPTRDSNGTELKDGDTVTLIKDLEVKGAGVTLKRGTTVKNISLTNNPEQIDCRTKEVKGLVLLSCFVKKLSE